MKNQSSQIEKEINKPRRRKKLKAEKFKGAKKKNNKKNFKSENELTRRININNPV